ncbi:MAG: LAGLIDADG family homing endonuclease, partial [Candidatus Heimdallarchaeota archaeon]|nr:LAGLIDADG family homing endonuclease [Candidatus Heimdallarchaeota archaeon]
GYITLPMDLREFAEPGCFYDLSSVDTKLETYVLTVKLSVTNKGWGFYIPQALCIKHSLVGETVQCYIYMLEHFPVKLSMDKTIRLPNSIVEEYEIKENDLFEVEVLAEKGIFREIILINRTDRSNRSDKDEYRFTLRLSDVPRSTETRMKFVKRVEKLNATKEENYENYYLPQLFPDGIMGKVHENEMIIFLGNHIPIFTPIRINLLDFVHYFGGYYFDGTKKGWSWRINASTPEQAVYYTKKYGQLILGNQLVFRLIYSKKPSDKRTKTQIRKDLIDYWKEYASVDIKADNIKLRETKHNKVKKWNKYGTLDVNDNRNLVMEVHLRLLDAVEGVVIHEINNENCWKFLSGILEGDGFVSGGKDRFGIGFSTHSSDKIIEKTLIRLGIQYRSDKSRTKGGKPAGISFHFGLFEVLLNLEVIYLSLFTYYPKRRDLFIERLLKQPSVEYLLKRKQTLAVPARSFLLSHSLDTSSTQNFLEKLEPVLKTIKV